MRISGISPKYGQYCRPQIFKPVKNTAIDSFVSFKGNEDNEKEEIVQGKDYLYTNPREYEKAKAKWQAEHARIKKEAPLITKWLQLKIHSSNAPKLVSDEEYQEHFVQKAKLEELERQMEETAAEEREHRELVDDLVDP